jgi:arylsulfatase A-like enzyme
MTGRYPHATGAGELHLPLPADKTIFTQPLKDAGYWTAAVGKWHLGEAVAEQVDYRAGASPEEMAKAWLTALAKRPANKPFMMWAAHSDPHRGYQRGAIDPPHTHADVVVPPFLPDTSEVRDDLALYYDEISRFDQHIGMVLGELDNLGIAENTLVAVMSDNGRPFPFCKTRVHVPGVRTPMIVRWPGHIPAGSVTRSVVSSIDIAPTILELAGLKPLSSFQGISFASILKNPQAITRTYAFAEHNWHDYRAFERGVHTSRYCYVRNWLPEYPGTPPADAVDSPTYKVMLERHRLGDLSPLQQDCIIAPRPSEFLYDVDADPNCVRNLAAEPGHAATLQVMRDQLSSWQAETADKFPGEDQLTPDGFDRQTGKRMIKGTHPALVK